MWNLESPFPGKFWYLEENLRIWRESVPKNWGKFYLIFQEENIFSSLADKLQMLPQYFVPIG